MSAFICYRSNPNIKINQCWPMAGLTSRDTHLPMWAFTEFAWLQTQAALQVTIHLSSLYMAWWKLLQLNGMQLHGMQLNGMIINTLPTTYRNWIDIHDKSTVLSSHVWSIWIDGPFIRRNSLENIFNTNRSDITNFRLYWWWTTNVNDMVRGTIVSYQCLLGLN